MSEFCTYVGNSLGMYSVDNQSTGNSLITIGHKDQCNERDKRVHSKYNLEVLEYVENMFLFFFTLCVSPTFSRGLKSETYFQHNKWNRKVHNY